jgi:hypothetical protein
MSTEAAPSTEEQQPKKATSGYRRLQHRHRRLVADHETLRKSYQELFEHQDVIMAELRRKIEECEQLQAMYQALTSDVQLALAENKRLLDAVAVLRSSTVPPQPPYQPQPRPAVPPGLPSLFSRGVR